MLGWLYQGRNLWMQIRLDRTTRGIYNSLQRKKHDDDDVLGNAHLAGICRGMEHIFNFSRILHTLECSYRDEI